MINEFNKGNASRILACYSNADELLKGGEGSKGGKVIGHTKSGKPIYERSKEVMSKYSDFSKEDHQDAQKEHIKHAEKYADEEQKNLSASNKDYLEGKDNSKNHDKYSHSKIKKEEHIDHGSWHRERSND